MKRCPNPDCRSEFFFGDTKTRSPFVALAART